MTKVLKFQADWCQPCKMLTRTLEDLKTDIPIEVVDIDENRDLAVTYGVRGVPTMIMLDNGVEVKRKVGMMSESDLNNFFNSPPQE